MRELDAVLRALRVPPTGRERVQIRRAYSVAAHWHRDQFRRSGDPYITHPVAVAEIVARLGHGPEMVCAALLHDVLEDTACPPAALDALFGATVAELVRDVTRLSELPGSDARVGDFTAFDDQTLILRLADRLHNQQTMQHLSPSSRRFKSRETLELFVPLAARLGVSDVERELERLARPFLRDGRVAARAVGAAAVLLPHAHRARWREEWTAELQTVSGRRARARHAVQLVRGMPRLAMVLRRRR